ncbi:MAG: hypothetical protein ACPIOQ_52545, partial [Promethearchaeia archaeon]
MCFRDLTPPLTDGGRTAVLLLASSAEAFAPGMLTRAPVLAPGTKSCLIFVRVLCAGIHVRV